MGRPQKAGQGIFVRIPEEEVEALDAWVEELRVERPGMSGITRSDLIRDSVMAATRAHREKKLADKAKG